MTDKDIPLGDLGEGRDVEASSTEGGASTVSDGVQAGVKNIEAVSMTWTKWGLIAAYARFVERAMEFIHMTNLLQYLSDGLHNLA